MKIQAPSYPLISMSTIHLVPHEFALVMSKHINIVSNVTPLFTLNVGELCENYIFSCSFIHKEGMTVFV